MPGLRDRPEDIVTLATFFRRRFAERHGLPDKEWSSEALFALESRPWPGNVRELENVVARAFVMAEGPVIRALDLGVDSRGGDAAAAAPADFEQTLDTARDAWTRTFLKRALQRHNGRRAETAKALGIGERTLFRYLEQLDIGDA
jgi:DNA-binding NtrC family response regulator